jgi:uncharacterized protein
MPGRSAAASEARRFFGLTFLWAWAFWWLAVFLGVAWPEPAALLLFALGGIGPVLMASVLVHRGASGERLGEFWLRVIDPRRVPLPWYLAILLVAAGPPVLARLLDAGALTGVGIDAGPAALATFTVGVLAGIAEEPGWRGYALDRLQTLFSALGASLLLGAVWALWHLPLFFIEGTYQNQLGVGTWGFWLFFVAIPPGSVLITWVYNNSRRSIFAAILLHALGNAVNETVNLEGVAENVISIAAVVAIAAVITLLWGARTLAKGPRRAIQRG